MSKNDPTIAVEGLTQMITFLAALSIENYDGTDELACPEISKDKVTNQRRHMLRNNK